MCGFNSGLRFSFLLIGTLSITGQKFSTCLENGSDRLRKGDDRKNFTNKINFRVVSNLIAIVQTRSLT